MQSALVSPRSTDSESAEAPRSVAVGSEIRREHLEEGVDQLVRVRFYIAKEAERELRAVWLGTRHVLKRSKHGARNALLVICFFCPPIKAVGGELALEDSSSLEEDARRLYVAFQHLARLIIEIHAMRIRICNDSYEGVAVASARTTGPLQELRLAGRHAAHDERRKVSNVYAHLKSRSARQHVRVPGMAPDAFCLELPFDLFSARPRKEARMLGRADSASIPAREKVAVVIEPLIVGLFQMPSAKRRRAWRSNAKRKIVNGADA